MAQDKGMVEESCHFMAVRKQIEKKGAADKNVPFHGTVLVTTSSQSSPSFPQHIQL